MKNLSHKFLFILAIFITLALSIHAQIDTLSIQKKANHISASKAKNPAMLAMALCADSHNEASKVIAISYWLATHINYDYKGYVNRRVEFWSPEIVLKKRKALCLEYANLFQQMCNAVDVKAEIVGGYTKDVDFIPNDTIFRSNHAWSAVKVDGKWELVDLCYASGSIVLRKQFFKKHITGILGIPYKSAYTFRKKYDPQWVFADPRKMIFTHLPELPMFQLLDNPVPLATFIKGDEAVTKYLAEQSSIDLQNNLLNEYSAKTATEKYIFEGEEGWKNNHYNNSLRGYMYVNALNTMYDKYYNEKTKLLEAEKDTLKLMKRYAFLADSLIKQTLKDNDLEFMQLQKRSENWKENLKISNKQYVEALKTRIKGNNTNLKISNKSDNKGKTMTSYFSSKYNQFKKIRPIDDVKRPKTPDSTAARQNRQLMHQQDSIWKLVCLKSLVGLYDINEPYKIDKVTAEINTEAVALKIYDNSYSKIKQTDEAYAEGVPLAHTTPDFIQKKWLGHQLSSADSLKRNNVDLMEGNLYNSQLQFYDYAKQYAKSTKDRLTMIKGAKRSSGTDQKEDSIYSASIRRFTSDMSDFQLYLKPYLFGHKELSNYLKSQNNCITNTISKLQKESDVENFRHNTYMEYRQKIRTGENNRAKLALKKLNKYSPIIDRSYKAKKK